MKKTIELSFPSQRRRSIVYFGRAAELLPGLLGGRRTVIAADRKVMRLWGGAFDGAERVAVQGGERGKTFGAVERLCRALARSEADRHTFLLALGGGVVTDVAAFAASMYMRGLKFGLIPTTLLAQADASVGGKNGVNLDGYKNMIGTFEQPEFVVCDTSLLATLPEREMRCGMAEIIKAAVIGDPELFRILRQAGPDGFSHQTVLEGGGVLEEAVYRAVKVKAGIVERDERESGPRRLLNLGHTFGHALEKVSTDYLHGEAVAVGIAIACGVGVEMGLLPAEDAAAIDALLEKYRLDTRLPVPFRKLLEAVRLDKKRDADKIGFVVPTGIGSAQTVELGFGELERLVADIRLGEKNR